MSFRLVKAGCKPNEFHSHGNALGKIRTLYNAL